MHKRNFNYATVRWGRCVVRVPRVVIALVAAFSDLLRALVRGKVCIFTTNAHTHTHIIKSVLVSI